MDPINMIFLIAYNEIVKHPFEYGPKSDHNEMTFLENILFKRLCMILINRIHLRMER